MTKKQAKKINDLINRLQVWSGIATRSIGTEDFQNAIKRYNEAADELIAMGVHVNKYKSDYGFTIYEP